MPSMPRSRTAHDRPADAENQSPADWIHRHQHYVWRYLRYLGAAASLAEDLAQETFLAALHHDVPDRAEAQGLAWLRTTARNLYFLYLRQRRRRREVVSLLDLDLDAVYELQTHPDLGDSYLTALRHCLEGLGRRGQKVLRLRYEEACTRQEMAAAMSLSEQGVKTLLRRVKEQLRACIEKRRRS